MSNNNSASDDDDVYEDADERYFYRQDEDEWGEDVNEDDDEEEEEDDDNAEGFDDEENDLTHSAPEMVNWYVHSHERYIKNLINDEQVEDYGLTIPIVATAAAAAAVNNDNNNLNNIADDETELAMGASLLQLSLSTGPIFGDSIRGDGVSCELKSDSVVPHHHELMTNWISYTDALRDCRILRLFEEFAVYKIHLHSSVSQNLFAALEGKHLKNLTLSETNLCRSGFEKLTQYLGSNTTLQRITLDKNRIDNLIDTEQLGRALRKHPRIEYLSLCDCQMGDNVNALADMLHAGLKEVCLGSNAIGTRGGLIVANYLASNPPMEIINLEKNLLNDDDVGHFSNSLKTNTRLRQLTLSANRYSLVGVKSLFKEIFNPTTLNNVADCNHACSLHLFTKFFNPVQRINNSADAEENRRGKILLALRIADSQILDYFEGDHAPPLELMPSVMKQIQQDDVFTNAKLTRIFLIVKGFLVPHISPSQKQMPSRAKRKRGSV